MVWPDWLEGNWFTLLQSAGIIGGLLFTAVSLRIDARVRRVGNLIKLTQQHRDIWTLLYQRPDLARVMKANADLDANPVTEEEELFVSLLILHLNTAHQAIQAGMLISPEGLGADIREFFSYPIPRSVWTKTRSLQNRTFVRFVEACLRAERSRS